MTVLPSNYYARWRATTLPLPAFREGGQNPPEHLLQQIWQHQRIQRSKLRTANGTSVRILHPGFWNHEAGPDFRGAVIQLGDAAPVTGDIEIDLHPADWHRHGHGGNPNYAQVILHIVWNTDGPKGADLPAVSIAEILDAPLTELAEWLGTEKSMPNLLEGKCRGPLRDLPREIVEELLRQAALIRLRRKAGDLDALARQVGWEQALWQGLFAALGYKQNHWPMRAIAERLPAICAPPCPNPQPSTPVRRTHLPVVPDCNPPPLEFLQARLLGISGLLPAQLPNRPSVAHGYVRRVWDHWWREREEFSEAALPRATWRFNNLRPANHPQRRLALASHWLHQPDLLERLERWFISPRPAAALASSLHSLLQVQEDDFWSHHYTFQSARLAKPQPLLGEQRVTDLAINVILPWFWIRAVAGMNSSLRDEAERRYFAWPASEDNAVLRLARQRLLGGSPDSAFKTAAAQQGLLQIVRDFCDHSNALCDNCRFPDLVRSIPGRPSKAG